MVSKRLTVHWKTFILTHPSLTLKERSNVKSDTTKRFVAYGFLKFDRTFQTSRINNKQDRDNFVKNGNAGDSNKITLRLSPKLVNVS